VDAKTCEAGEALLPCNTYRALKWKYADVSLKNTSDLLRLFFLSIKTNMMAVWKV
jgi:hypothetical protein